MPQLRVALGQLNPTVGDLSGNLTLACEAATAAARAGADVLVLPEMLLTGYPIEDLALRPSFQAASRRTLEAFAAHLADDQLRHLTVIVGFLDTRAPEAAALGVPTGQPLNSAAVIHNGRIVTTYDKHHLPNYGVFDEYRYFVPGDHMTVIRVHGVDIAIAICEDLWQDGGPVAAVRQANAGLLVVLNGSPYERNKDDVRLELCQRRAREAGCAVAYVNLVGGQDELVFDGDSLVVDAAGTPLARAPQFESGHLVVDLTLPDASSAPALPDGTPVHVLDSPVETPSRSPVDAVIAPRLSDSAEIYAALVQGLRDYVGKNGFRSVLLGLSGGIDSALVAAIACDALGADRVFGISMPSRYSSQHSRDDAADLAARTGLALRTIPIEPMVSAFHSSMHLTGLAEENLQARVRGTTLMAISNQEGHLVLATGNKSELAVGYSTMYGDAVGGFAPIKDIPKTLVWQLARWRNDEARRQRQMPPIPESSISKPPSAELRPDQKDTDSLPEYEHLDAILDGYIHADLSADDLVAAGHDRALVERVLRLVDLAEYKRRQYPPGTKISLRAFGRDRRLPITSRWRETVGLPASE